MKYRWFLFVGLVASTLSTSQAQQKAPADTSVTFYDSLYASEITPDSFSVVEPGPVGFGAGEKLVFSVQYGLITAGEATLEVRNIATIMLLNNVATLGGLLLLAFYLS